MERRTSGSTMRTSVQDFLPARSRFGELAVADERSPEDRLAGLLTSVSERPGLYGLDDTYATFVAFIYGFDWGSDHQALDGMSAWMDERYGVQRLAWEQQVLAVAFPDRDPSDRPETFDENRWAIDAAVVLLREFVGGRQWSSCRCSSRSRRRSRPRPSSSPAPRPLQVLRCASSRHHLRARFPLPPWAGT